jgi:hypothetical protein
VSNFLHEHSGGRAARAGASKQKPQKIFRRAQSIEKSRIGNAYVWFYKAFAWNFAWIHGVLFGFCLVLAGLFGFDWRRSGRPVRQVLLEFRVTGRA